MQAGAAGAANRARRATSLHQPSSGPVRPHRRLQANHPDQRQGRVFIHSSATSACSRLMRLTLPGESVVPTMKRSEWAANNCFHSDAHGRRYP